MGRGGRSVTATAGAAGAATAARAGAGQGRIGIARLTGGGQLVQVLLPQRVLLRAQLVQVIPGEDAGAVAIAERWLDGVVAHRLQRGDFYQTLAGLQSFLAGAVAHDFG